MFLGTNGYKFQVFYWCQNFMRQKFIQTIYDNSPKNIPDKYLCVDGE